MDIEEKFPDDDDGEEDKPVPWRNVEWKVWLKVEDMVIIETKWNIYQSLDY